MTIVGSLTARSPRRRVIAESRLATVPLLGISALLAVILVAFAGGYGYHRDELYFLVAGRHLAWAYADQGPLTPLIAHLMDAIAPGSLTVLRIPSAVMAAGTVFLTGALARELGGRSRAQLIAAGSSAVASVVLVTGHLLSTSTFDLLAWTLLTWLIVRVVRTGNERLWPVAGVTAGVALLNKPLIAFLLFALAVAVAITGPRRLLRSRWLGAGIAPAVLIWSPWLVWQTAHHWPQLKVSSSIASGGSASSQPRWALVPFQLLLVSPVLCPVWIAGLWSLWRRPTLRPYRFFALAWLILVVIFLATAGKPYYLAGMFPVLLAAGAGEVDEWLKRGHQKVRASLLAFALTSSGIVSAVIALPVLSAQDAGPVIAANADVGETIGWPELVHTIAGVYRQAGRGTIIFTSNYGEAGADRSLRAGARTAGRLQRPQRLLAMGTTPKPPRPRHHRRTHHHRTAGQLPRVPPERLDHQQRGREQRRARPRRRALRRTSRHLGAHLAAPATSRLTNRFDQSNTERVPLGR